MAQRIVHVPWDQQPQELPSVDPDHPLGRALDVAWIGGDLGGVDVLKGHKVALLSATAVGNTTRGKAFTHTGTAGSAVAIPGEAALPYVQIGYGYFNTAGGAWVLAQLANSAGGYTSRLALASSTTVAADLRWNFGTQRTLTITLPTTLNTPIRMALVAYSATDYRFFANGQQQNGTLSPGTFGSLDRVLPPGDTLNGGMWFTGFGSGAALSDEELLRITANPEAELWSMFRRRIWVPVSAPSGAYSLAADQGSYSLAGQAAGLTATRRLAADQGSYVLTGQDAALRVARLMAAAQGSYALTGQDATLTYSSLTNYTLAAEQGAYTLSGQAATLLAARLMAAAQGSYALTGQDATLTYTPAGAYTLTADQGAYALTGQDAALRAARVIAAAQGSYALTGQDATFTRGVAMVADQGSYALTGQDAGFARTYALSAGFGSYALTGQIVSLSYSGAVFGEASWVFLVSPEDSDLFVLQDDNVIRVPQEDYPAATIQ